MSISTSLAGPYFSGSGEISFSALRNNFKQVNSGVVTASEYFRDTSPEKLNPIVPDSDENIGISTLSDGNLSLRQFRGSVKSYEIVQSGTHLNLDISSLDWKGNLTSNILKRFIVEGTIGSDDASNPAASLDLDGVKNLTIEVSGNIYGAAGKGGGTGPGAPEISGQDGGSGLYLSSLNSQGLSVLVRDTAKIYAGGGGGEKGNTGSPGSGGRCSGSTTTSGCGGAPGCPGGWSQTGEWGGGCCQTYCQWCGWSSCGCQPCSQWQRYRSCSYSNPTSGGPGGAGGNGGLGRGYNNQSESLNGSPGSPGGPGGGCGAQPGSPGGPGGSGGEWGVSGGETTNTGNKGGAGSAIFGSGYTVSGTLNSNTIKGAYLA